MSANNSQVDQATALLRGAPPAPVPAESSNRPLYESTPIDHQVQAVRDLLSGTDVAISQAQQAVRNLPQAQQRGEQSPRTYLPSETPPDVLELQQHAQNFMAEHNRLMWEMGQIDMPELEESNPGLAHRLHDEAARRHQVLNEYFMQIESARAGIIQKYGQMELQAYAQHVQELIPEWRNPEVFQAEAQELNTWMQQQGVNVQGPIPPVELRKHRTKWLRQTKGKKGQRARMRRSQVVGKKTHADQVFAAASDHVAKSLPVRSLDKNGDVRLPPEKVVAEALRNL